MNFKNLKNIRTLTSSIQYSQDVLHIVQTYAETMEYFFSNTDNQIAHDFCYQEFVKLSDTLKAQAKIRGLIK